MPAQLGVKQRGSTQWSACYQVRPGEAPVQVGNNFALIQMSGATGLFGVGETLTEAVSGITAKVTAVSGPGLASGSTPTICVNSMSGAFTGAGLITGGSSGRTGTWTASIALEVAGTPGQNDSMAKVITFKNTLFVILNNYIWSFNGTNWLPAYAFANPNTVGDTNCSTGLFIFNINNVQLLGAVYGGTGIAACYRIRSLDGVNFYEATLSGATGMRSDLHNGASCALVWQNILYWISYIGSDTAHCSWDPSTDVFATVASPSGISYSTTSHDMFIFDNRLFQLRPNESTSKLVLYEFILGAYSQVMNFSVPADGSGTGLAAYQTSKILAFDDGAGNLILRYYYSSTHFGWIDRKLTYSSPNFTDAGEIQSTTLIAALAYPNDIAPGGARWGIYVDTDTVPGSQAIYFWYSLNDTAGSQLQWWRYIDSASPMVKLGVGVGDVGITLPNTRNGGGERLWTLNQPGVNFRGWVVPATVIGPRAIFDVSGGGTKTVRLYWSKTGEAPVNLCTLDSPSRGTIGGGSTSITSWPADGASGQVTWNSAADGVPSTAEVQVFIAVS